MQSWVAYLQFFVTLIVIVDPFFTVPLFLSVTSGQTEQERSRTAAAVGVTVCAVLVITALTGESVLTVLGTSFASFQVGGGLVLLLMALAMLQGPGGELQNNFEDSDGDSGEPMGVVPLGVPLLAGPGAIGAVIIGVGRGTGGYHRGMIVLCVVAVSLLVWAALRLAVPLGRWMGRLGTRVATRVLGLLLAAIAVEYIARGLRQLFPPLAG